MALISGYWLLDIPLIFCTICSGFYAYFLLFTRKYWANQNIPYADPEFIFGNLKDANYKRSFQDITAELYFKHKDKKYVGIWAYCRPVLFINDVNLIKNILIKDFHHFQDRGLYVDEKLEPLAAHLFNLSGQDWRNLRVKLTPTFTSGKMKMMYHTMYDVGEQLQRFLEKPALEKATLEMKDILACFTTDMISSCAFGIETKSMEHPDNDFRKYGKMIFDPPLENMITGIIQFVMPWMAKYVPLRTIPRSSGDFFMKTVKEVISHRESNDVKRKDFLQLLIELKNQGFIEDVDVDRDSKIGTGEAFTIERAAAQAFVFFGAGFETSSSTLMFILYELVCHPELQDRLQCEIDEVLENNGGKLDYQNIQEMTYLDQVVEEGLRKYPAVPILFRECTKEYKIPGEDKIIKKGEFLFIPVSSIQSDPQFFPEPDRFDPERHTPENKAGRDSCLNLTFGAGPRNCIGSRFGIMQVKIGLIMLLSKYKWDVAPETPIPMVFNPRIFFPSPLNGMPLKISKRE